MICGRQWIEPNAVPHPRTIAVAHICERRQTHADECQCSCGARLQVHLPSSVGPAEAPGPKPSEILGRLDSTNRWVE